MKRGWFLLLALSAGLNVGLLYSALFTGRGEADVAVSARPAFIDALPGPPPQAVSQMPPCESCDVHCQERLGRLSRHLGLGEDQRERMSRVLDETMPRIIAARGSVQQARCAVHAAYDTDTPDPARVHTAVRAMNAAQAHLDSLVAETMLLEIGVLTPEQLHRYMARLPWAPCGGPAGAHAPGRGKSPDGRRGGR